jgi:uncharacterized membrane protein
MCIRPLVVVVAMVVWLVAAGCGGDAAAPVAAACPNDTPAACPASAPSFARDVAPLLQDRCGTTACHAPTGAEPNRPVQTWGEVAPQAEDILSQIHTCRMPPAGQPTLLAAERQLVLAWVVCGAPDN